MNNQLKDSIKNNFWKLNLSRFVLDLAYLWIAVLFLFYQQQGLSLTQIGIATAVVSISVFLFEIPTGIFADRFGRKSSLILGGICQLLFPLTILFNTSYLLVILASATFGLGRAFESGADVAILHDTNRITNKKTNFKEIIGKYQGYGLIAGSISLFSAGFIAKYNFNFVFIISAIFFTIHILIVSTIKEPEKYYNKNSRKQTTSLKHFIESGKEIISNKEIIKIFIYSLTVSPIIMAVYKFHQIYADQVGINISHIGIIFATMYLVAAITSFNIKKIENKIGLNMFLYVMPLVLGLSYILMGSFFSAFAITFVLLESLVGGTARPIIEEMQNEYISKKKRATTLSIISMAQHVFIAIISIIMGILAESKSLASTYVVIGISVIIIGLFFANKIKHSSSQ